MTNNKYLPGYSYGLSGGPPSLTEQWARGHMAHLNSLTPAQLQAREDHEKHQKEQKAISVARAFEMAKELLASSVLEEKDGGAVRYWKKQSGFPVAQQYYCWSHQRSICINYLEVDVGHYAGIVRDYEFRGERADALLKALGLTVPVCTNG